MTKVVNKDYEIGKAARAVAVFVVKSADEINDERIIEGVASTVTPDRTQDVVDPKGLTHPGQVPLLWQHNHDEPIGTVLSISATKEEVRFKAQLAKSDEPGLLKDELDKRWQQIKAGLVRGISIGFRPIEFSYLEETGGLHFKEAELLEISVVTIPMHQEAGIETVKSLDDGIRQALTGTAADEKDEESDPTRSGGTQSKTIKLINPKGSEKMNPTEQLAALQANIKEKSDRQDEIMAKAASENRMTDADEAKEYDDLGEEVTKAKQDLARVKGMIARAEADAGDDADAATVVKATSSASASASRSGAIYVKDNAEPGIIFTRYAIAIAQSKGNPASAEMFAKNRWKDSKQLHTVFKAAVAAGTTTDPAWAGSLVDYTTMENDFIDFMRPQTIIGRMSGFHSVPFMTRVGRGTAGGSAGWVDEGAAKPVTSSAFDTVSLDQAKIAAISVITQELARTSSPSAEMKVRRDLTGAVIEVMDRDFLDPLKVAGTSSPASVLNGATPIVASGTTAAALKADVVAMLQPMITANVDLTNGYFVMKPGVAINVGMMENALGNAEFPGMTMNGGTFMGYPCITSNNVPLGADQVGSPGSSIIAFVLPGEILLADDGQVVLDASDQASLQMDDAPAAGPASMVSLWQNNMLGIRAERFIKWTKGRDQAAGYIDNAAYVA